MINETSLKAVSASRLNEHYGKPLYDSYCFSRIPRTVVRLLTGEGELGLPADTLAGLPARFDKVILFFLDSLGWQFFERYQEHYPFLARAVKNGVVSKLTTQFPSTTAAHTTTIHTGLTVGESGVYEWFYYEPAVDRIIAPLLFSFMGDRERNTLRKTNVSPQAIYPTRTLYQALAERSVHSYVFQHRDYTPSPFSDTMFSGAKTVPYKTLSEALVNLGDALLNEPGPAYYFLYADTIDAVCHLYGPSSRQLDAEVDTVLNTLERIFYSALAGKLKNTLLLVTADHGQMEVFPDKLIFLNRLNRSIEPLIRSNAQGELLVPAGSPRDMFLYVVHDRVEEARAILAEQLSGRAEVFRTADLIDQGMFGGASEAFLARVGNLVVLPYAREQVWWYEKGKWDAVFRGHHGGLSREEMETVLLALPF